MPFSDIAFWLPSLRCDGSLGEYLYLALINYRGVAVDEPVDEIEENTWMYEKYHADWWIV